MKRLFLYTVSLIMLLGIKYCAGMDGSGEITEINQDVVQIWEEIKNRFIKDYRESILFSLSEKVIQEVVEYFLTNQDATNFISIKKMLSNDGTVVKSENLYFKNVLARILRFASQIRNEDRSGANDPFFYTDPKKFLYNKGDEESYFQECEAIIKWQKFFNFSEKYNGLSGDAKKIVDAILENIASTIPQNCWQSFVNQFDVEKKIQATLFIANGLLRKYAYLLFQQGVVEKVQFSVLSRGSLLETLKDLVSAARKLRDLNDEQMYRDFLNNIQLKINAFVYEDNDKNAAEIQANYIKQQINLPWWHFLTTHRYKPWFLLGGGLAVFMAYRYRNQLHNLLKKSFSGRKF